MNFILHELLSKGIGIWLNNMHVFDALDFLAELMQHVPPKGAQLISRYGLYSSRIKRRWQEMSHVEQWAPAGWAAEPQESALIDSKLCYEPLSETVEVNSKSSSFNLHDTRVPMMFWGAQSDSQYVFGADPLLCQYFRTQAGFGRRNIDGLCGLSATL